MRMHVGYFLEHTKVKVTAGVMVVDGRVVSLNKERVNRITST